MVEKNDAKIFVSLYPKPFSWHSWHLAFRRCLANLARYFHSFSQIQIWHAISTVFANSNLARYYHSFSQNQIWHAISTVFSANSNLARYFHFFFANPNLELYFHSFSQIHASLCMLYSRFSRKFACKDAVAASASNFRGGETSKVRRLILSCEAETCGVLYL